MGRQAVVGVRSVVCVSIPPPTPNPSCQLWVPSSEKEKGKRKVINRLGEKAYGPSVHVKT